VLVLMVASPAVADDPANGVEPESQAPAVGIGAKIPVQILFSPGTIEGLGGLGVPTPSGALLLPMLLDEDLRLEPHVAFGFSSRSTEYPTNQSEVRNIETEAWSVAAGVAFHHLWSPFEATRGYAGVKAGLIYGETSTERAIADAESVDTGRTSRGLYAGPVLGGEYQPTDTFGFGVEASLVANYSTRSSDSSSSGLGGLGGYADDTSAYDVRSEMSFFGRIYLW
jgi:hypothetical protein